MGQNHKPVLYAGTSNITLPVRSKQELPEAYRNVSRLVYYSTLFNSLEVNSSFYKIPMAKTVEKWAGEVPDDFRFTFKLNRELTHSKEVVPDTELVKRFMDTINAAGDKAGSLLIQFAAGKKYNSAYLERLLSLVQKDAERWDVCVELRHASWYKDSVYRLLQAYNAAVVIHDKARATSEPVESWTDFAYYRFHGPSGDYKGTYELEALQARADEMKELLQEGKRVYTYFNNTVGNAVFDALALQELVTGKVTYEP
jgi:uncharacterized protein YecE (DUF72 family)